jgi:hypothetical protein
MLKTGMNIISEVVGGGAQRKAHEAPHTSVSERCCDYSRKIYLNVTVSDQKCFVFVCNVYKVCLCPNCSYIIIPINKY